MTKHLSLTLAFAWLLCASLKAETIELRGQLMDTVLVISSAGSDSIAEINAIRGCPLKFEAGCNGGTTEEYFAITDNSGQYSVSVELPSGCGSSYSIHITGNIGTDSVAPLTIEIPADNILPSYTADLHFTSNAAIPLGEGQFSLNFRDRYTPRHSYVFASEDYNNEERFFILNSGYRSIPLDTFLAFKPNQNYDSLSALISNKDDVFLQNSHNGYISHYFIFDMDEVFKTIDYTAVRIAYLKWKGLAIGDGFTPNMMFEFPQAGHAASIKQDTVGNTVTADIVDSAAIYVGWFGTHYSFFKSNLLVQVLVQNYTTNVCTLRTDYIEVVLFTNDGTTATVKPSVKTHHRNLLSVNNGIISYQLTKKGPMSLDLFSLNGKFIKRLDQGVKDPGSYSKALDRQVVNANGCYIIKLTEGNNRVFVKYTSVKH